MKISKDERELLELVLVVLKRALKQPPKVKGFERLEKDMLGLIRRLIGGSR